MKLIIFAFFIVLLPITLYAETVVMSLNIQPSFSFTFGATTITPRRIEVLQFGTNGNSFTITDPPPANALNVVFSAGILTTPIDFFVLFYNKNLLIPHRSLPANKSSVIDNFFDLRAFDGFTEKTIFNENFSVTFYYTDAQIAAFNESSARVYFWNETGGAWDISSNFTLDQVNNKITILTDHLTLFAIFGELAEGESPVVALSSGGGIISAGDRSGDFNRDGKVDVLDFNILMVNWGKIIPSNLASVVDINRDRIIGIEDFNLLMAKWTG